MAVENFTNPADVAGAAAGPPAPSGPPATSPRRRSRDDVSVGHGAAAGARRRASQRRASRSRPFEASAGRPAPPTGTVVVVEDASISEVISEFDPDL